MGEPWWWLWTAVQRVAQGPPLGHLHGGGIFPLSRGPCEVGGGTGFVLSPYCWLTSPSLPICFSSSSMSHWRNTTMPCGRRSRACRLSWRGGAGPCTCMSACAS